MTGQERAIDRSQVGSLSSPFGSSILRYPLAAAYLLHWLSLGGQWWWVSVALPWSVILGPMQDMGAQQTWRAEAKGTTELPSGYQGFRSKNETLLMVQDRLSTSLGDISRSDWQQHLRSTCSPESWMGPESMAPSQASILKSGLRGTCQQTAGEFREVAPYSLGTFLADPSLPRHLQFGQWVGAHLIAENIQPLSGDIS